MKSTIMRSAPIIMVVLGLAGAIAAEPPESITPEDVVALRAEIARLRQDLDEQRQHYEQKLTAMEQAIAQIQTQLKMSGEN